MSAPVIHRMVGLSTYSVVPAACIPKAGVDSEELSHCEFQGRNCILIDTTIKRVCPSAIEYIIRHLRLIGPVKSKPKPRFPLS